MPWHVQTLHFVTYWGDSLPYTTLWYSGPKVISAFKKTLGVFHSDGVYLHVWMKYGEIVRRKRLYMHMCVCACEREKCLRERRLWGSECLQFFTGECLRANKSCSDQEVDNSEVGNTNTAFNMLNVCHMKTDKHTSKQSVSWIRKGTFTCMHTCPIRSARHTQA